MNKYYRQRLILHTIKSKIKSKESEIVWDNIQQLSLRI